MMLGPLAPSAASHGNAGLGLFRRELAGRAWWTHSGYWGSVVLHDPDTDLTLTAFRNQSEVRTPALEPVYAAILDSFTSFRLRSRRGARPYFPSWEAIRAGRRAAAQTLGMGGPTARVVADSVSVDGARVTTVEATMHRFMLAELNTHRVFSRNSASSRAIPVARQIERVLDDPAMPVEFGGKQAGMQAGPPLEGDALDAARAAWLEARDAAVDSARRLADLGVHKQVVNRLLEPFMWHTVIVTATDWDGFWHQRCSPLAQPEIRIVADAMRDAFDASDAVAGGAGRLASAVHHRRRPGGGVRPRRVAEDLGGALRPGFVPQSRRPARPRRRPPPLRALRRSAAGARVPARARGHAGSSRPSVGREPARLDPATTPGAELTDERSQLAGFARSDRFTRLYLSAVALVTTKPLMSCAGAELEARSSPAASTRRRARSRSSAGLVVAGFFGSRNVSSEPA